MNVRLRPSEMWRSVQSGYMSTNILQNSSASSYVANVEAVGFSETKVGLHTRIY
jgi:hypothetical protein